MRAAFITGLLLVSALAWANDCSQVPKLKYVCGQIRSSSGPLKACRVDIGRAGSERLAALKTAKTDERGNFDLGTFEKGAYYLRIADCGDNRQYMVRVSEAGKTCKKGILITIQSPAGVGCLDRLEVAKLP